MDCLHAKCSVRLAQSIALEQDVEACKLLPQPTTKRAAPLAALSSSKSALRMALGARLGLVTVVDEVLEVLEVDEVVEVVVMLVVDEVELVVVMVVVVEVVDSITKRSIASTEA